MTAIAVYPPSGSSGELQFANSSGQLDAAQAFWDASKSKLYISGNLEVLGTETVIDTQHLQVEDAIIGLGSGSAGEGSAGDRGFIFTISGETNPSIYWDESENEFRLSRLTNVPADTSFNDPSAVGEGGYQNLKIGTLKAKSGGIFDTGNVNLVDIGTDTFFYVSGSVGSKDSSRSGTAVFGGDIAISGSSIALGGLSGSLTRLTGGTSYLVADTDIVIASASNGSVSIASSAQDQRKKFVYELTSSHPSSQNFHIPSLDFSLVDFSDDRVDIFVNGQLMTSGSTKDYVLPGPTGSIRFYFELLRDDLVTVRTY